MFWESWHYYGILQETYPYTSSKVFNWKLTTFRENVLTKVKKNIYGVATVNFNSGGLESKWKKGVLRCF